MKQESCIAAARLIRPKLRSLSIWRVARIAFSIFCFAAAVLATANAQTPTYSIAQSIQQFGSVTGLATDRQGNVYVATDEGAELVEYLASNGTLPAQPQGRVLARATGADGDKPIGSVAVDSQGNVYFSDFGVTDDDAETPYSSIVELVAVNGSVPDSPAVRTVFTQQNVEIGGIAVDLQGNLFFSTFSGETNGVFTSAALSEAVAVNGLVPENPVIRTLASESGNTGLLDGSGEVVSDSSGDLFWEYGGSIREFVAINGVIPNGAAAITVIPLAADLPSSGSRFFTLDQSGAIFLAQSTSVRSTSITSGVIQKYVPLNGVYPSNPVTLFQQNQAFGPMYLATDAKGNLFVADEYYSLNGGIEGAGYQATDLIELSPSSSGTLSISPTMLSFGMLPVGQVSAPQIATITNSTGNAIALTVGSLTDSKDFTQTDNCNGTVAGNGGTCTVTFSFAPQSSGGLTSAYSIADSSNPGAPLAVALSGNGTVAAVPQATLAPSPLDFGTVAVGASGQMMLTLTNSGTTAINVYTVAITGSDAQSFTYSNNTCQTGKSPSQISVAVAARGRTRLRAQDLTQPIGALGAGASCTVQLAFAPTSPGPHTASFQVTDDAGTQTANLTGTGIGAPQAALTPGMASFGSLTSGSISSPQTFTLSNAGSAALPITSVSLNGGNASSYQLTSNSCGMSLAAGSSCTIGVAFAPATSGSLGATLAVADSVGTQTSVLSGSAVAPVPPDFTIAASPASQSSYRGTAVSYTVQIASLLASNPFTGVVSLTAKGLPAGASVSFSPSAVTPNGSSTMKVTIAPLQAATRKPDRSWPLGRTSGQVALASVLSWCFLRTRRKYLLPRLAVILLALVSGGAALMLNGCGSTTTGFAIPVSTSTITVTGTSGSLVHTTTVTLTIQ